MKKPTLPHTEPILCNITAKQFLLLFTLISLAFLLAYIVFSIWVNTHSRFGDYGMFKAHNDRILKSRYLNQLPLSDLPNSYILGSSNTLPFKTEDVNRIFKVNSFNLGAFFGKAHEFYAYLSYLINERKIKPKLIFIGIDPWTFTPQINTEKFLPNLSKEISNASILSKHLSNFSTTKLWLNNFISLFSWQSLEHTLLSAFHYKMQRKNINHFWQQSYTKTGNYKPYIEENPPSYWGREIDTYYTYLNKENKLHGPWEEKRNRLVENTNMPSRVIYNYLPKQLFSTYNTNLFKKMIALLQENNIPTILIYLPAHPYLQDVLEKHINYSHKYNQVKKFVRDVVKNTPTITIYDASYISNFGGTPSGFHDNNHMTPKNTQILLEKVHHVISTQSTPK